MFHLQEIQGRGKDDREENQAEGDEGHLGVVREEEGDHDHRTDGANDRLSPCLRHRLANLVDPQRPICEIARGVVSKEGRRPDAIRPAGEIDANQTAPSSAPPASFPRAKPKRPSGCNAD